MNAQEQSGNLASGQAQPRLVVVTYDPQWPARFAEIRGTIQRTIPGTYHSVEHVGSTAVPGMAANPIIDIDVVMREGMFERIRRGLESLGYVYEGDLGGPGRRSFDLRDPGLRAVLAEHHLNVCEPGCEALRNHRDFRNFMLAHPEWVERLSAYKLALLRQYRDDYYGYERAKAPMVEEILRQARGETSPPAPVSGEGEEPPYEASGRP
jgi:GrpB-like predicted nucleotidyltransferase (UPF0157 family)